MLIASQDCEHIDMTIWDRHRSLCLQTHPSIQVRERLGVPAFLITRSCVWLRSHAQLCSLQKDYAVFMEYPLNRLQNGLSRSAGSLQGPLGTCEVSSIAQKCLETNKDKQRAKKRQKFSTFWACGVQVQMVHLLR